MDDTNSFDNNISQPDQPDPNSFQNNPKNRTPWGTVEGRVISLVSSKGGVGKTTSAVNLGAALALSGHTVLVMGTDPHCGVCHTLGKRPEDLDVRLGDVFNGHGNLLELVNTSPLDGLFFVSPGITSLQEEEEYLDQLTRRTDDFVAAVDQARNLYDTILIDCAPGMGPATRASLMASDSYLVPVQAEELCRESVAGLISSVDTFRDRHFGTEAGFLDLLEDEDLPIGEPRPLELEGLFLTMVSERTRMGQHVTSRVEEDFGHYLFSGKIPRTTRLSEMALRGKPAVIYDRRSKGSRSYFDLADELVDRYRSRIEVESIGSPAELDSIQGKPLPEVLTDQAMEASPAETGGGLDGFLAALGGASVVSAAIPSFEEPQTPEMVSLDDLLAEEEAGQGKETDDWDEGNWPYQPDRLN